MVDLIETGISGLDSMLYGGVPKDNQIILAGGPGAGKTLLAFEFIYKGAKRGETGIFFALEEDPKKIIQNAKEAFSEFTDIDDLIKSGKIIIDGNKMISAAFQGAGQSDR
ncbi:MAG: ATPase domain-containing protein, partial [Candidatus Micrarchaeaceae archaeon]